MQRCFLVSIARVIEMGVDMSVIFSFAWLYCTRVVNAYMFHLRAIYSQQQEDISWFILIRMIILNGNKQSQSGSQIQECSTLHQPLYLRTACAECCIDMQKKPKRSTLRNFLNASTSIIKQSIHVHRETMRACYKPFSDVSLIVSCDLTVRSNVNNLPTNLFTISKNRLIIY